MKFPSLATIITVGTAISTGASFVCNILPKPEKVFNDYPCLQKAYAATVGFIAITAINWRSNVHSVGNVKDGLNPQLKLPLDQPAELAKGASNNV